jgi:hypothetical protein
MHGHIDKTFIGEKYAKIEYINYRSF